MGNAHRWYAVGAAAIVVAMVGRLGWLLQPVAGQKPSAGFIVCAATVGVAALLATLAAAPMVLAGGVRRVMGVPPGPLPRPAVWMGTGLVLDAVAGGVVAAIPQENGVTPYFALSAALCWVHLVLVPVLADRRGGIGWREAGLVLAGAVATALAIAVGSALGLVAGFVTLALLTLPGFALGGTITGLLTAKIMRRLLADPVRAVPGGRAAGTGAMTALALLPAMYLLQGGPGVVGVVCWLGLATGVATVPNGAASWLRWRWRIWWGMLLTAGVPAAALAIMLLERG